MTFQQIALIGCPDDRGVANNGGRPGAAKGPNTFRHWLHKPKGPKPVQAYITDYGNVPPMNNNIQTTHALTAEWIKKAHDLGQGTLVVGGGHDYAYAHLKGLSMGLSADQKLGCINIDPHFDMRPNEQAILSGSPFYMALEESLLSGSHLVSFGIQQFCNGKELWDYARKHHVPVHLREQMRFQGMVESFRTALYSLTDQCDQIAISLDLDAINMAYAPGVSAPNVEGFSPSEVLSLLEVAAQFETVRSLGLYELNPHYDYDAHTARLAVTAAFTFLDHKLNN